MHSRNHVSLLDQTRPVAAPVTACPSGALVHKLHAVFQRRLDFAFLLVLDPGLPLVVDEPSGHEVVVVRVEYVLAPALTLETVEEVSARKNLGSVGASAARHARSSAVHVVGSRDLEVASLNVGRAEPVPDVVGP